jgi:hypothetical protein
MDCAGFGFSAGLAAARARVAMKGRMRAETHRLHMVASIFWKAPEAYVVERIIVHPARGDAN